MATGRMKEKSLASVAPSSVVPAPESSVATYEGMFILDSNKYASAPDTVAGEVLAMLTRVGATLLASRPWQDSKLTYAINKHRKGVYYLTYFTVDTQKLTELNRLVKLSEVILRHLTLKLDPALIEPMVAMAQGRGEVVSTFKDTESTDGTDSRRRH